MKILRMESGGFVLYCKMLDEGKFYRPGQDSEGKITWSDFVLMVEGIVKNDQFYFLKFDT